MEDVITKMTKKVSLHEGQGSNPFESKRRASDLHVSEVKTQIENRNLANIRIDDSQLEKNLAIILDRLSAVEFVQESMGSASRPATPQVRPGSSSGRPGSSSSSGRPGSSSSSSSSSSGRYQGGDPVQKLIQQLSDRLGKIESLVESSAGDDAAAPPGELSPTTMEGRPATMLGDRKIAMSSSAFAAAQAESSKEKPNMPVITRTIFKELTGLTARVKRFEDSIAGQKAFQDAKDQAQDEMLAMEMDRLNDDIRGRVGAEDLDKLERKVRNEMRALKSELEERQDKQALKIANEVGAGVRTLRDQVKVINEATKGITDNLDARLLRLEKEVRDELDEVEQKTRELVEETVERAVSELRAATDEQFQESRTQLEVAATSILQVASKQDVLAQETGGEALKVETSMAAVTGTLAQLLDGGGLKDLIKQGAAQDLQDLNVKITDELAGVASKLKAGSDESRQAVAELEARLAQGTDALRKYVEDGVEVRAGACEESLARLAASTAQQLSAQAHALDHTTSGFEHTCAGLKAAVARAHAGVTDAGARLDGEQAKVAQLEADVDARVGGAEKRLAALDASAAGAGVAVASLDGRLGAAEAEAQRLATSLKKAHAGVAGAAQSVAKGGDEARAHRRALDGALQSLNEELAGRLDEDRAALAGLERAAAAQKVVSDELRDSFGSLVTKESFWDVMAARARWHSERLGKHCNATEAACSASSAPKLTTEATAHLSGHAQRIAKVLAAQADATVLQAVVGTAGGGVPADSVASLALGWDAQVDQCRADLLASFVASVEKSAKRGRPRGLGEDG